MSSFTIASRAASWAWASNTMSTIIRRPMLRIKGEVLSDPADPSIVDWISIIEAGENNSADDRATPRAIRGVYLRGGCDMMNIGHYFGSSALGGGGEHNIQRNSVHLRLDHSLIGRYCIEGAPSRQWSPLSRSAITRMTSSPNF